MENTPDGPRTGNPTALSFSPDRRITLAAGAAALLVAVAAAVSSDAAGRLLLAGVVLVLLAYALTDLIFAPRVTATSEGLVLNSPFARGPVPWSAVESIHADTRLRLGLRSTTLEIDAGATIAVFTRRALGTAPEQAAALLDALDPRPGRADVRRNPGGLRAPGGPGGSEGGVGQHGDGEDEGSDAG